MNFFFDLTNLKIFSHAQLSHYLFRCQKKTWGVEDEGSTDLFPVTVACYSSRPLLELSYLPRPTRLFGLSFDFGPQRWDNSRIKFKTFGTHLFWRLITTSFLHDLQYTFCLYLYGNLSKCDQRLEFFYLVWIF